MLGLAGVPSLVMFVGFLFMPESPRWLVKKGRDDRAKVTLEKIRGHTDVDMELKEIKDSCRTAQQQSGQTYKL